MTNKKDNALIIGRFSGLHEGQMYNISNALNNFNRVYIMIGSVNTRRTPVNPFTYEERMEMLYESIPKKDHSRVTIMPLCDRNTMSEWVSEVYLRLSMMNADTSNMAIVGHDKDQSSFYLKSFTMPHVESGNYREINATDLRKSYFENGIISPFLTPAAQKFMRQFKLTPEYKSLVTEFMYYEYEEPEKFKDYPHPEDLNFACSDNVVECAGHILLVKRKSKTGDGCWALPGGFKNGKITFFDNAIKELYEETKIDIPVRTMRLATTGSHLFDEPKRSQGIPRHSMAYHYVVQPTPNGKLPRVSGGDNGNYDPECDTYEAYWFNMGEIREMYLYDDHKEIIEHFTRTNLTPKKFII